MANRGIIIIKSFTIDQRLIGVTFKSALTCILFFRWSDVGKLMQVSSELIHAAQWQRASRHPLQGFSGKHAITLCSLQGAEAVHFKAAQVWSQPKCQKQLWYLCILFSSCSCFVVPCRLFNADFAGQTALDLVCTDELKHIVGAYQDKVPFLVTHLVQNWVSFPELFKPSEFSISMFF